MEIMGFGEEFRETFLEEEWVEYLGFGETGYDGIGVALRKLWWEMVELRGRLSGVVEGFEKRRDGVMLGDVVCELGKLKVTDVS